jgi:hypothetical protein
MIQSVDIDQIPSDRGVYRPGSVHVRQLIELIEEPHCSGDDDDHEHDLCLMLWNAASWPEPQPPHLLD